MPATKRKSGHSPIQADPGYAGGEKGTRGSLKASLTYLPGAQ
jgi:hypothetical protein